ncbi:hypothetical protein [Streptomyces sp. NBC_01497]|uniref:hypothetical protein n=1 Tax=Streptomyces sp. NBC_01497 TaxID=2903885 RepID=UPI002E322CA1|nr:hypothetical protein [Streptomyces sp. NBC_01497]
MDLVRQGVLRDEFAEVSRFRSELYDGVLCTDGPIRVLVDFALVPDYTAMITKLCTAGFNQRAGIARLRHFPVGVSLPRAVNGEW